MEAAIRKNGGFFILMLRQCDGQDVKTTASGSKKRSGAFFQCGTGGQYVINEDDAFGAKALFDREHAMDIVPSLHFGFAGLSSRVPDPFQHCSGPRNICRP